MGLRKVFEAADAARLPVTSVLRFFAIVLFPNFARLLISWISCDSIVPS
jgi:hypothetical protein